MAGPSSRFAGCPSASAWSCTSKVTRSPARLVRALASRTAHVVMPLRGSPVGRAMTTAPAELADAGGSELNIEAYIGWGRGFWIVGAAGVDMRSMRSNFAAPSPRASQTASGGLDSSGAARRQAEGGRPADLSANLVALAERGVDLLGIAAPSGGGELAGDTAARRAAESAALPFLTAQGGLDPANPPKGIVVEGLESPWMLQRVFRATGALADGYAPPLFVIEPDVDAALRGLGEARLVELIRDPRAHVFIGPEAVGSFEGLLRRRMDFALPDFLVQTPGGTARDQSGAAEAVRRAHQAQQALHVELEAQVRAAYSARDDSWWRRRYSERASPLRVLLPISRYSTFVRHSAADLAEALRAAGPEAQLLTEPDDHSRLVTVAYLRQFAEWQPDLVVLINYTRRHMGQAVPAGVPFVCWVQDRMPQLFDEAVGRSQGGMDFLLGHLHVELFAQFGYPKAPERARFRFVPASARAFHAGVAERDPGGDCDIAYISHQSETADAARDRLAPAFSGHPAIARAVDRVFAGLKSRIDGAGEFDPIAHLRCAMVAEALAAEGMTSPDPRLVGAVLSNFAVPIAERLWRHGTLEWAARIAERRGWRFALFGNGWERHPTLARWARPALPHDDALRKVYGTAGACLHASLTTNAHQRVFECALSGGIMLRRGPSPDREVGAHALRHYLLGSCEPVEKGADGVWRYEIHEGGALDPMNLYRVAGFEPTRPGVWIKKLSTAQRTHCAAVWPVVDVLDLPDYAFPRAMETMFGTEAELERALERTITDASWRRETAEMQRRAAMERHTYDRLAEDLMGMVSGAIVGVSEAPA